MPKNNLDLLAKKAEALQAMRDRKDPGYQVALELFLVERVQWQLGLQKEVLARTGGWGEESSAAIVGTLDGDEV